MYNTKEEEKAIRAIRKHLGDNVEILNPHDYDEDPDFAESKKRGGLTVCFRLIDQTECLVFQRFRFPKQFRSYVLEYLQHADEYGHYKSRLRVDVQDVPMKLQELVISNASVVTPGVAKEVDYAFKMKKKVYEFIAGRIKVWNDKLKSNFEGPTDPLYGTISLLLKAYRSKKHLGFPPFWWLSQDS
jgi:hypothetical protein